MAESVSEQLDRLAREPDPVPMDKVILGLPDLDRVAETLAHFEARGDENAAAGNWADAVVCYRVAKSALLRVDYYNKRVRKKLERAEMLLLEERCAGPIPRVPRPMRWRAGLERVEWLAMNLRFDEADRLLDRVSRAPADHGDQGIETSCRFEQIGDHAASKNPEAARWFYSKASEWFRAWVASSSSGGEGLARSQVRDSAAAKLARFGKRRR